jgi:hypothetical protein
MYEKKKTVREKTSWPITIREMAQDLIIATLKGNEKLCLMLFEGNTTDSVLDIMAFAASQVVLVMSTHIYTCYYFSYIEQCLTHFRNVASQVDTKFTLVIASFSSSSYSSYSSSYSSSTFFITLLLSFIT